MLKPLGQFHLTREYYRKKVPRIVLHIRKQTQTLKVRGGNGICLVDKDEDLFSFIGRFKKQLVKDLEKFRFAPDLAFLARQLTDDLPQDLDKGHVGICHESNFILALVQRIQDQTQR